jgi:hypothetical protein
MGDSAKIPPLLSYMPEVLSRGNSMLILAGWILISVMILAFVGFMLTVSANWIFKAPKDGTDHHTAKPSLRKNHP